MARTCIVESRFDARFLLRNTSKFKDPYHEQDPFDDGKPYFFSSNNFMLTSELLTFIDISLVAFNFSESFPEELLDYKDTEAEQLLNSFKHQLIPTKHWNKTYNKKLYQMDDIEMTNVMDLFKFIMKDRDVPIFIPNCNDVLFETEDELAVYLSRQNYINRLDNCTLYFEYKTNNKKLSKSQKYKMSKFTIDNQRLKLKYCIL